jgi:hypothetical protein
MAKRQIVNAEDGITRSELVEAARVLQGGETATIPPAETAVIKFTLGVWAGRPQWQCPYCPWDTLEGEQAIVDHWEARHAPPPPIPPLVQAFDKRGKPVT